MRTTIAATLILLYGSLGLAQEQKLAFEVASAKPADVPQGCGPFFCRPTTSGGPGTDNPERITYSHLFMRALLTTAFGIQEDQISGPDWISSERYDIVANVPPGATKQEVNEMLKNLLIERFGLAFHLQKKEFDLYELTVAKGGPKLKAAAPADGPPPAPPAPGIAREVALDADGFPQLPPGRPGWILGSNSGSLRATGMMQTMANLITNLGDFVGSHIADKTGLAAMYDIKLKFSPAGAPGPLAQVLSRAPARTEEASDPVPDLFTALEKQLGLKLEKKKGLLDTLMIDHIERVPSAN